MIAWNRLPSPWQLSNVWTSVFNNVYANLGILGIEDKHLEIIHIEEYRNVDEGFFFLWTSVHVGRKPTQSETAEILLTSTVFK